MCNGGTDPYSLKRLASVISYQFPFSDYVLCMRLLSFRLRFSVQEDQTSVNNYTVNQNIFSPGSAHKAKKNKFCGSRNMTQKSRVGQSVFFFENAQSHKLTGKNL